MVRRLGFLRLEPRALRSQCHWHFTGTFDVSVRWAEGSESKHQNPTGGGGEASEQ